MLLLDWMVVGRLVLFGCWVWWSWWWLLVDSGVGGGDSHWRIIGLGS